VKRSPELAPLSRDHHQGLNVALQLKRAPDGDSASAFLEFVTGPGGEHFRVEEEIVLPAWIAGDPAASSEMAQRVLAEHLALRAGAAAIRSGPLGTDELRRLGSVLEGHIRFEERELFPRIESGLSPDSLAALGAAIAGSHHQT
jgi:hypothetical protein